MIWTESMWISWLIVSYIASLSFGASVTNIEVVTGQTPFRGRTTQIVCSINNFGNDVVAIYRTESSRVSGVTLNACIRTECANTNIGRYIFTVDQYHVNITIQNLTRTEDQKWWHCRGSDSVLQSLHLTIYTPPTTLIITQVPPDNQDLSNGPVSITCQTSCALPAVDISWFYREGNNIRQPFTLSKPTQNVTTLGCTEMEFIVTSSLTLARYTIFPDNADVTVNFECGTTSFAIPDYKPIYSNVSHDVEFSVKAETPSLKNKTNDALLSGGPVQFVCETTATRPAASVTWRQGSTKLTNISNTVRETSTGLKIVTSIVTFTPSKADDKTTISCETGIPGQIGPPSDSTTITVWYAPDVNVSIQKEGSIYSVVCNAVGKPSLYTFLEFKQTWNGAIILNPNIPLISHWHTSPLTMTSHMSLEDSGTYTCVVNNGIHNKSGVLNQESSASVLVEVAPKIFAETIFVGQPGNSINISIPFYSHPTYTDYSIVRSDGVDYSNLNRVPVYVNSADILTHFYDTEVTLNGNMLRLVILNFTETDFSRYTLSLQNAIGKTTWEFELRAESTPITPTIFLLIRNSNPPTFYWKKGFNGGHKQMFIIETSLEHSDYWEQKLVIEEDDSTYRLPSGQFAATIHGLLPGTYKARITAENKLGKSRSFDLKSTFNVPDEAGYSSQSSNSSTTIVGTVLGSVCLFLIMTIVLLLRRKFGFFKACKKDSSTSADPNVNVEFSPDTTEKETKADEMDSTTYEHLETRDDTKRTYDQLDTTTSGATRSTKVYENLQMA